jgi:hypothetical protein
MAKPKKNLKFYETPEFEAEKQKWDEILANTPDANGEKFVDIEKNETFVRPQIFSTLKTQYDGGNEYHLLCQEILRNFKFTRDVHRVIFSLHAEGKSQRDIQEILKSKHGFEISQQGISQLIKRIRVKFITGV